MRCIEDNFEYQAREILKKACDIDNFEKKDLNDIDDFTSAIWNNKLLLRRIAEEFYEAIFNYSGDEIFEELRESFIEEKDLEENEE